METTSHILSRSREAESLIRGNNMGFLGTFTKGVVTGVIVLGGLAYLYSKFSEDAGAAEEAEESDKGEE